MRSGDDRRTFLPLGIWDWDEEGQSVETECLSGHSQVEPSYPYGNPKDTPQRPLLEPQRYPTDTQQIPLLEPQDTLQILY